MKKADPFYSSKRWLGVRMKVLKRDGWRCTNGTCGASVKGKGAARVDHIKPRLLYPELALHLPNLRTLCVRCDQARHHHDKLGKAKAGPPIRADGFPEDGSWD